MLPAMGVRSGWFFWGQNVTRPKGPRIQLVEAQLGRKNEKEKP